MKIEKVNDNQIRCTLTRADLDDRHLKLSELAYGTEKAKSLFRDMMQQANYEFGFEAEDMPLMIEAVPLTQDTVLLIITKVEYPEELDTRFSKFSEPDENEYPDFADAKNTPAAGADDILGFFKQLQEKQKAKFIYGVLEKPFRNYYGRSSCQEGCHSCSEACRRTGGRYYPAVRLRQLRENQQSCPYFKWLL